jgi:hypothetical protein
VNNPNFCASTFTGKETIFFPAEPMGVTGFTPLLSRISVAQDATIPEGHPNQTAHFCSVSEPDRQKSNAIAGCGETAHQQLFRKRN